MATTSRVTRLAQAQGLFFAVSGAWPLLSIRTFEKVTGPKVDTWLVKTVGGLALSIGATMFVAARRRDAGPTLQLLGMNTAAAFAAASLWYVGKRRISAVYLLDAAAELGWILAWATLPTVAASERELETHPGREAPPLHS